MGIVSIVVMLPTKEIKLTFHFVRSSVSSAPRTAGRAHARKI